MSKFLLHTFDCIVNSISSDRQEMAFPSFLHTGDPLSFLDEQSCIIGCSLFKGDPDPVDEHGLVLGGGCGEEQWPQILTGIDNIKALLSGDYRLGK